MPSSTSAGAGLPQTELILILVTAVLALLVVALLARTAKLNRLYSRLTKGTSGGNIEEMLLAHLARVDTVAAGIERLNSITDELAAVQKTCMQRVGMVRYDAFEDVGGQQSFAFVVLDARRSGIAVSSVYSRNDVRVYAKLLENGKASHPLTKEEQQAMSMAERQQ